MGESRGAFAPVFSTDPRPLEQRDAAVEPPARRDAAWTSTTGSRPRACGSGCRGARARGASRGTRRGRRRTTRSAASIRACSRASSSRSRSRCSRTARSTRPAAVHHRQAKPGELRAAVPRGGRPDRGRREAGVLDAQGARWRTSPCSSDRSSSRRSWRARTRSASTPGRFRRSISSRPRRRWRSGART